MTESWKPIAGYEGLYEVSDQGRVRSMPRVGTPGRVLKPSCNKNGRLYVALSSNDQLKTRAVHVLVAAAFVPGRAPALEVCHNDGDKTNNVASNLRWDTRSENVLDRVRHGTHHNTNKTHCPKGHPYSPENTYVAPGTRRRNCRICKKAAS